MVSFLLSKLSSISSRVFAAERNFYKGDGRWASTRPQSRFGSRPLHCSSIGTSIRAWFADRSQGTSTILPRV
jgi:hypothetical protein